MKHENVGMRERGRVKESKIVKQHMGKQKHD
jgi:hypothetical protein